MHLKGVSGSVANPKKAEILLDAAKLILEGKTLQEIATKHGISRPTLHIWLSQCEDYQELRQLWIDSAIAQSAEGLESAEDQLSLARARELTKYWQWMAERRDKRYQPKQELTVETINLTDRISKGRARARIIEHEPGDGESQDHGGGG